jgi:hypothetical protein
MPVNISELNLLALVRAHSRPRLLSLHSRCKPLISRVLTTFTFRSQPAFVPSSRACAAFRRWLIARPSGPSGTFYPCIGTYTKLTKPLLYRTISLCTAKSNFSKVYIPQCKTLVARSLLRRVAPRVRWPSCYPCPFVVLVLRSRSSTFPRGAECGGEKSFPPQSILVRSRPLNLRRGPWRGLRSS